MNHSAVMVTFYSQWIQLKHDSSPCSKELHLIEDYVENIFSNNYMTKDNVTTTSISSTSTSLAIVLEPSINTF